jgi:hypothetical protein
MGSIYKRPNSPYLWIKYYQHGRPVRESTGTIKETVARRILRTREGDVEHGIPIMPKMGLITSTKPPRICLTTTRSMAARRTTTPSVGSICICGRPSGASG